MSNKLMFFSMIPAMIFLVVSYCSKSHADNLKWFVVPDSANPSANVIVGAGGFTPPGAICQAPVDATGKPYPIEAVDIADVTDSFGNTHKACTMDQAKLSAKLAADASAKAAADSAAASVKSVRDARILRIKAACGAMAAGVQADICNQVVDGL